MVNTIDGMPLTQQLNQMKLCTSTVIALFVGASSLAVIPAQASSPPHCDEAAKKDYKGTCYAGDGDLYPSYWRYQEGWEPFEKGGSSFK